MRQVIVDLAALGPLPTGPGVPQGEIDHFAQMLDEAARVPPTADDLRALASVFPPIGDPSFGLCWRLVALLESSPVWPDEQALVECPEPWASILRQRLEEAGKQSQA